MNIAITIPQKIPWKEYEKELRAAENGSILNYKVRSFPKVEVGAKCYIVYKGIVKGWMKITGFSEKEFTCDITGKHWKGKFVERAGKFHAVKPTPMAGFRGYRYVDELG